MIGVNNGAVVQYAMELCEPIIEEHGMELVDVEYVKEGTHWFLRFYIDKEGGIDLDDCALISQNISELLDKDDKISSAYMLEVSSPGLERPLKKDEDFEKFKGKLVSVHTAKPYQGYKTFTGYLEGLIDGELVLKYENAEMKIPKETIEKAHLTFEY